MTRVHLPLSIILSSLIVGLSGCGGPQIPVNPPSLCFMEAPMLDDGSGERAPRANEWVTLILGQNAAMDRTAPAQNCTGQPIRWPSGEECGREDGTPTSSTLQDASVIVRQVDPNTRLVWIQTHRYAGDTNEALGPIALVEKSSAIGEVRSAGWVVRSVGMLRGYTGDVTLRLRGTPQEGLLIAEGTACSEDDDSRCARSARILPMVGYRFMPTPVYTSENECVGPAQIYTTRYQEATLPSGWSRLFHLTSSFQYAGGGLTVIESITATDTSEAHPEVPPRRFRLVDAQRSISLEDGRLIAEGTPVWPRMLSHDGSTAVDTDDQSADADSASE